MWSDTCFITMQVHHPLFHRGPHNQFMRQPTTRSLIMPLASLLIAACGTQASLPPGASPSIQSPAATSPSIGVISLASNAVLQPDNCAAAQAASAYSKTSALGMDSITLSIPQGWADQTSQVTGISALLRIHAPTTYGSDNATFTLISVPGPRPGSSAHEQATEDASGKAGAYPQTSIFDCAISGQDSSFYEYLDPLGDHVFRLLVLHSPTSRYPFLYAVELSSQGEMDDRAKADIRAILRSWSWGAPKYNPNG
jgi:hypothetical protein